MNTTSSPEQLRTSEEEAVCTDDCCSTLNTLILQQELLRKPVYVVYGSEKGNAQQIAERCHRTAVEKGYRHTKLGTLDEHLSLIKDASAAAKKKKEEGENGSLTTTTTTRLSLVVVVSTTGNGDAPKGAERFFSFIKKRDHPPGMLSHIDYLVLALGDTNYEKFCYVGKTIDNSMHRLGANRLRSIATADAPNDFEVVVESFFDHVWDAVWPAATRIQHQTSSAAEETTTSTTLVEKRDERHRLRHHLLSSVGGGGGSSEGGGVDVSPSSPLMRRSSEVPTASSSELDGGVSPQLRAAAIAEEKNIIGRSHQPTLAGMGSLSLGESVLSSSKKSRSEAIDFVGWRPSESPVRKLQDSGVTLQTLLNRTKSSTLPSKRKPFSVSIISETVEVADEQEEEERTKIVEAKYLVNHRVEDVKEWKVVVEAVLELPKGISYLPGDSIAIPTRNPRSVVCAVLRRIKEDALRVVVSDTNDEGDEETTLWKRARALRIRVAPPHTLSSTSSFSSSTSSRLKDSSVNNNNNNDMIVESDLASILESRVDLISTPGKSALFVLSDCCTEEGDEIRMKYLSSFAGRDDYMNLILGQRLTVAEVLEVFPTCRPTTAQLLTALDSTSAPLPRYYSIANSPLEAEEVLGGGNRVRIIYSVARDASPTSHRLLRGLCSSELERACFFFPPAEGQRFIRGKVSIKPNPSFRVPDDLSSPLIMVGAGTGVAPFLGFISHRSLLRKEKTKREKRNAPVVGTWRGGGMFDEDEEEDFDFEEEDIGAPRSASTLSSSSSTLSHHVHLGEEEEEGAILYRGCRREGFDDLKREEVEVFLRTGALARCASACSRPLGESAKKQYVQDAILSDAARLGPLLLSPSTHVFVCGSVKMAKDVLGSFREILRKTPGFDKDEKEFFDDAVKRGTYVQDIWG